MRPATNGEPAAENVTIIAAATLLATPPTCTGATRRLRFSYPVSPSNSGVDK